MYGPLHPKSDVHRLGIKRNEGGRCLMSVKLYVREEENSLCFYVVNSEENLIKGVAADQTFNTEATVRNGEFKKQKHKNLKKTAIKENAWTIHQGNARES